MAGAAKHLTRRATSRLSELNCSRPYRPFAARASHSASSRPIASLLQAQDSQEIANVRVDGFVRSVRSQKRHSFVSLGDGSSLDPLQAVVPADLAEGLTIGAAVRLQGSWAPSPGRGQSHELRVTKTDILGPSNAQTFPIQKKYQTPEYLRTMPHLRPRVPFNAVALRFRSELISSLTRFFESRDFVQTHTPILTSSDCEGAGEVFQVTTPAEQAILTRQPASTGKTPSFFRRPVYSTVSGQLHLEALAQSLGHVWTLSPTFRAEHSDTPRHLSEFYMLEAEVAFTDSMSSVMDLVEDMLRHISSNMAQSRTFGELTREEGRSADLAPAEEVRRRWEGLQALSWPRITYTEAIELLQNAKGQQFEHKPVWGEDLHTEHEKYIASTVGGNSTPVFVTNYPKDIKAFYMRLSANAEGGKQSNQTVDCFDLLVPDFCEIAGGSMREHRLDGLLQAMHAKGMSPGIPAQQAGEGVLQDKPENVKGGPGSEANNLDWYLDLRRWGCPPHGGFGLGFDRLLCYLTGIQTIRDTTAFPRWYGRCDC